MFVCLCRRLTDAQLRETYRQANSAEQVFELIGETPVCGMCVEFIESDLRQRRDSAASRDSADEGS